MHLAADAGSQARDHKVIFPVVAQAFEFYVSHHRHAQSSNPRVKMVRRNALIPPS